MPDGFVEFAENASAILQVFTSIVAHGLTDTVGARWMAERTGLSRDPGRGDPAAR